MQEEDSSIRAQAVLRICSHLEDSSTFVHVSDAIFHRAEISIGYCNAISKIKLNVGPLEITLQERRLDYDSGLVRVICVIYHPTPQFHSISMDTKLQFYQKKDEFCSLGSQSGQT